MLKEWPLKKSSVQIWVDPKFKKFIRDLFPEPEAKDPERTRRLLDKIENDKK